MPKYRIRLAGGWKVKVRYINATDLKDAAHKAFLKYGVIRHIRLAETLKYSDTPKGSK